MKYKCRRCDICGCEMGKWDFQFWLKAPRLKAGRPDVSMKKYDICDLCGNELMLRVMEAVREMKAAKCDD